jgi:hypothetical protein
VTIVARARTFTAAEASRRWRIKRWLAADFIADFVERGFVEVVGSGAYSVTPLGMQWSEALDEIRRDVLDVEAG